MESQGEPSKSNQGSKEPWFQSRDKAQSRSGWWPQLKSILWWLQHYINSSYPFQTGTWRIDGIWGKKGTLTYRREGHIQLWKTNSTLFDMKLRNPLQIIELSLPSACDRVMYLQLLEIRVMMNFYVYFRIMDQTVKELQNNICFI